LLILFTISVWMSLAFFIYNFGNTTLLTF
jgi:hypothetical protein